MSVENRGQDKMHFLAPFFAALLLTLTIHRFLGVTIWLAWLLALNPATFLTYGYDKRIARTEKRRVPERTLLLLALAGGTLGAIGGMRHFRHKTAKTLFRRKLSFVVAFQVLLLVLYGSWSLAGRWPIMS